jgi:archaellum component FlaC
MSEQELLAAIGKQMDEKLEPIKEEIGRVSEEVGRVSEEVGRVSEEVGRVSEEVGRVSEEVGRVEHELTILIENNHNDIGNLLRENFAPIRERVSEFSDYPEIKSQVSTHDHALKSPNKRLTVLEKKTAI